MECFIRECMKHGTVLCGVFAVSCKQKEYHPIFENTANFFDQRTTGNSPRKEHATYLTYKSNKSDVTFYRDENKFLRYIPALEYLDGFTSNNFLTKYTCIVVVTNMTIICAMDHVWT